MKTRFLAFLAAVAVGSATVLIYAAQNRQHANATLGATDDCSACEMSAAKAGPAALVKASDGCCASESAATQPAVATLDAAGCPYDAAATANANLLADVQPVNATAAAGTDACCASEGAAPAAAKIE